MKQVLTLAVAAMVTLAASSAQAAYRSLFGEGC
jgi:hypothetical protein